MKMTLYKYAGVLIWTTGAVMAFHALARLGNLPQGAYRIGLWVITAAYATKVIHAFLWGAVAGHWATFANIGVFYFYSFALFMTSMPGLSDDAKWAITVAFTLVPLFGLLILRAFRKSRNENRRASKRFKP